MSQAKVRSALVTALTAAPAAVPAASLFFDNKPNKVPSTGLWALVQFSTTPPVPKTLGNRGFDECTGQLAVFLTYPSGKGTSVPDAAIASLSERFVAGKTFTYQSQVVQITSAGSSTAYGVDNQHRTPFLISWKAQVQRNSV